MKTKLLFMTLLLSVASIQAKVTTYTLDLSDENITYNENNVWDGLYNNDALQADGFVFSHTAPYGEGYYEGFIASCNSDNANWYDAPGWSANQWGCMAQGGVGEDDNEGFEIDGIIGKPFLINYYSAYSLSTSDYGTSFITIEDNSQNFMPQGVYVCNHPWGYYGCTSGDGFATPLAEEGGYYKVTFNGVNIAQGTTKSVDFYLAERQYSDRNSDGVINENDNYTSTAWTWCDLTTLGAVDIIYITMDSSDKGEYGMNTATLVCLDGLKASVANAVNKVTNNDKVYAANGYLHLSLHENQCINIINANGVVVKQQNLCAGTHMMDVSHLSNGIYIIMCGNKAHKIVL